MRRTVRGTLLATSALATSALALVAFEQPANAAACSAVTNPGLPYTQSGNTCVTFNTTPSGSGNVTNNGSVTPGTAQNVVRVDGVAVDGTVINNGTVVGGGIIVMSGGSSPA